MEVTNNNDFEVPKAQNPIKRLQNFYKQPANAEPIEGEKEITSSYVHWRMRIFYSIFIGYVVFYLCKKNISAALPLMSTELGFSNTELGILGGSLYLTYGIGKFINGILADSSDVRKFLPTALIFSAIANLCFVASSMFITPGNISFFGLPSATVLLWILAFFWGANGWFQSAGFPSIAKSLTFWYSNKERGTKWALWSTSHQTGTFLSVIMSGFVIASFGWKAAFIMPALIAIVVSIWLFDRLRDRPTSLGLPDVEKHREPEACKASEEEDDDDTSYIDIFKEHILFNRTMWMLAFAYIFVYIIRFGTEDWIIKYLVEAKQNSLTLAAIKLSFLPLFGIIGTISAGYLSDTVFKGKRAPINVIYMAGIAICLFLLTLNGTGENFIDRAFFAMTNKELSCCIPFNGSGIVDFILIGLIGLFTYGPQMLIGGLCAVESSSKKVASAATGFTGSFGYLGAVLSAFGTGYAVDKFGWNGAIGFWMISAILCMLICIPMWNEGKKK